MMDTGQQWIEVAPPSPSPPPSPTGDDVPTPLRVGRLRLDVRRESIGPAVPSRRDPALEDKRGRRKSWQPRFERKRRKGVSAPAETDTRPTDQRQKRPSWWNIFVPDHWPSRSRRASQDVGRVYKSAENIVPWLRNKSRSVDHGVTPPFNLDALRSKVEGRFESVESAERRRGPPDNVETEVYTVADRDTLTSVAARFDTTPSELTKLNRLGTPFIFPGQQLHVPKARPSVAASPPPSGEVGATTDTALATSATAAPDILQPMQLQHQQQPAMADEERELLETLRPVSPKPGHAERVRTPLPSGGDTADEDTTAFRERFLKINVRHITDGQGVVGGVLLVTPNAVMFDPNVSDALVIEHGPESYGVIAPMEFVVNAAIYHDIAHMRVGSGTATSGPDAPRPEIYYARPVPDAHSPGKDSLLVKDETFPELGASADDADSVCSCAERDGNAFPKAFERDLVTPVNLPNEEDREKPDSRHETHHSQTEEEDDDDDEEPVLAELRSLDERRRSMLDHHWAIPSKDRSLDSDTEPTSPHQASAPTPSPPSLPPIQAALVDGLSEKQSCHDSGIDIREPPPVVPVVPHKKVYSDADIVLSSDWVPPVTIVPAPNASEDQATVATAGRKKTSSVSFSLEGPETSAEQQVTSTQQQQQHQETRKNKMLKRLSYPLAWMETFSGEKEDTPTPPHSADQAQSSAATAAPHHQQSVFSKVFSRRSSIGTFMRQQQQPAGQQPRLDYRSMVSVEDMPELFVSFDKLIPRPARPCDDPPLYLRLRMGKPLSRPVPRSTPLMSYGKKKMRPEYWFSVPRNRVDELYRFLQLWVPHLYGELCPEEVRARGFHLVDSDTELWEDEDATSPRRKRSSNATEDGDEVTELTRESWEVVSMSEELRRALLASGGVSLDADISPPDLVGVTEILTDEHREKLCRHLPARAEGYVWTLVFSTSQHGFSLNSMYRKMQRLESPILLVIQDTDSNVFGALTSCALKVSDHFYGTGESLLFRFTPTFQVFNWTGENLYFIKGNNESLSIGAGDGKFGLWLDGDLNQGHTERCKTYANEPLTPKVDFVVKTLECWAFV